MGKEEKGSYGWLHIEVINEFHSDAACTGTRMNLDTMMMVNEDAMPYRT